MKLIVYTLNADGTIPDYVIEGGYLPSRNENNKITRNGEIFTTNIFPQNLNFVGIAKDEAEQIGFASESALLTYANEKGLEFRNPITKEIDPVENVVSFIWSKVKGV